MPIKELRESIGDIDLLMANDQERVQIVQKRINLKEGSIQRNMLSMDLFFDDPPYIVGRPFPRAFDGVIEFYLTPTPLILSSESLLATPRRGMDAANTNVLFKAIITPKSTGAGEIGETNPLFWNIDRFPQDFIASNANFPFYHDQLYLTMVFHGNALAEYPVNIRFNASLLMSYKTKKVSEITAAIGVISERFNSMIAQQESMGRIMPNPLDMAGQYIPSYNWGGIRPELMVSGSTLSQFFLHLENNQPEKTITTGEMRTYAKQSRQMVPNPDAFGTTDPVVGGVPDWFRTIIPKGAVAGAVREQFPPRVSQDDPTLPGLGNVICV
jgi:hypothetical protein